MVSTIISAICVIVIVTLILVALLLWIKARLTPSGSVRIGINQGAKELEVTPGDNLMNTLASQGIFLPFGITEDDEASGKRTGGFGSTDA